MIEILRNHIREHIDISDEKLDQYCKAFSLHKIKKREFLLKEGDFCRHDGFVVNGCFKVFHTDRNGAEQILYFGVETWWISDIDSFINSVPSKLSIQAIEDSEILLISHEDKDRLYMEIPEVERLSRRKFEKSVVALQRRIIDNLSKPADERYLDFLKDYPQIARRLTNVQIAAYLGVTPEFLSRIRRKIVGNM